MSTGPGLRFLGLRLAGSKSEGFSFRVLGARILGARSQCLRFWVLCLRHPSLGPQVLILDYASSFLLKSLLYK